MRDRKRLLEISVWYTIQEEIRKGLYSKISKNLLKVANKEEREILINQLSGTDTDFIESILSNIAEVLDI